MRWLVAIAVAALSFSSLVTKGDEDTTPDGRALNNPKSAEFPWESVKVEWTKKARDDEADKPYELVSVAGIVRATNAFNAIVPQEWHVVMTHTEELWEPAIVRLGDQTIFTSDVGKRLLAKVQQKIAKDQQAKDQRYRESLEELEKEGKRKARLEQAMAAGQESARKAIVQNKWNNKVAAANITKAAKKAAGESEFAEDADERAKFIEGFEVWVNTAKSR